MSKVRIYEEFHTTMGMIIKVENDRIFKIGDIIQTDEGEYIIKGITFSSNPAESQYVNLLVTT